MKHLITDIIPIKYNLTINLDLKGTQFNGENIIEFIEANDNEIKKLLLNIAVNGQARF